MKRIFLFLLTNFAVMIVLSASMSVLGVGRFMTANGLDLTQLLIFSAIIAPIRSGAAHMPLPICAWPAAC